MEDKLFCKKCEKETNHKLVIFTRLRGAVYECLSCGHKIQRRIKNGK